MSTDGRENWWPARLSRVLLYLCFLPLRPDASARAMLRQLVHEQREFISAAEDAWLRGERSRRLGAFGILYDGLRSIGGQFIAAFEVWQVRGLSPSWVYPITDTLMVYAGLPLVLIGDGFVLGGPVGLIMGLIITLAIWGVMVRRWRAMAADDFAVGAEVDEIITLPNIITFIRLATIAVFPLLLLSNQHLKALGFLAFLVTTDWLDGFVARGYDAVSRVGTMLDPATDRIMLLVVASTMWAADYLYAPIAALLIARELTVMVIGVTMLRPRGPKEMPVVVVDWTGKVGFVLIASALIARLAGAPGPSTMGNLLQGICFVGLVFSTYATVRYVTGARSIPEARS